MSEIVLRDVDRDLLDRIHQNAILHGVTVEDEVKEILHSAIENVSQNSVLQRARAIRERNAHLQKTNTLDLLREDRDNR